MVKELLQKMEPVVYEALNNACTSGRISHAWLFAGPPGTPKKEAAYLLAQSLFCEKQDGIACEQCEECIRIANNSHMDFAVLDGSKKAISKNDIDELQRRFSLTSAEKGSGNRCYLILNAENSSAAAMNSMLKFLEEPGEGLTAILTTDNIGRLLPTIISRCTVLSFRLPGADYYRQIGKEHGMADDDISLLSRLVRSPEELLAAPSSAPWQNAVAMFQQYLGKNGPFSELLVDYDISYRQSEKADGAAMVQYFLGLLDLYAHDVILKNQDGPKWYREALADARGSQDDYGRLIIICNQQKERCNKFNDVNLLMAQTYERLEDFKRESGT
ncbi:MAG: DNA polymerase III subunit [Lactimicrobium massiliense]|nr:DNA polymerase III subunit [Lactimicrobium massiliense]MDD6675876.1 DNA polymerase III subunit [Lactimicrobium massiliense]